MKSGFYHSTRDKTQAEEKMDEVLREMDPDSSRFLVLQAAKKFKSNWLDLGGLLSEVLKSEEFKDWGFEHFESYCKKELMIKPETAEKLIISFRYLKKHKPELASAPDRFTHIPDFKSIDGMIQVEQNPPSGVKEADLQALRRSLFDEALTPRGFKKRLQEISGMPLDPQHGEDLTVKRIKQALENVKKWIGVFEPDRNVFFALKTIEEFIERITPDR
ncbi:MAG: hypothetical protein JW774_11810 [Candidatus Aureabacteria bacterium]|nr:hypothetical protein [Candidatus Auribacterota bacterium]